ncbi:DUF6544 family protein [Litoreibacter arenae]|uniref:Uncharacterized protein n=1 Tax=Litoreibacter arenae DSM 19593 TaxID=1123360 RepID=S9RSM2_9RHOB|nr:DUF6544 family protein [Litoreibacter arenae]EPX81055.1 hypothetical protein thalar_00501 [Litoreibacter arenae DSM 19593]
MDYMRIFFDIGIILLAIGLLCLLIWRHVDHRADRLEMKRLLQQQPTNPPIFSMDVVADLPEPARRFFAFAISEGTPLYTVAEIEMSGKFSLGSKEAPNYTDISSKQVLAAPEGFVWKMSGGLGLMRLSGSDSGYWTRFWLGGFVPVARLGGNPDHRKAAFGRYVAEAVFWTPAALLPREGIEWQHVDETTARVVVRHKGLEQAVDIHVDEDGRPTQVVFPRWSDANPEKTYRIQPFGGYLSDFREVQGFRLPMHVEAGNQFGTDEYFPFYLINVTKLRFPPVSR